MPPFGFDGLPPMRHDRLGAWLDRGPTALPVSTDDVAMLHADGDLADPSLLFLGSRDSASNTRNSQFVKSLEETREDAYP